MNEVGKAAFIMAQSACAQIEATGMATANHQCAVEGVPPIYSETDFHRLINKYGISHNAVLIFMESQ